MKIPLGIHVGTRNEIFMPISYYNGRDSADTIIILGMTGSGKSVISRRIIHTYHRRRPVFVFDHTGRDHYYGFLPNQNPKNLAPGEKPSPVFGYYFFYKTNTARPKLRYEITVTPNFSKYNYRQFESLGFNGMGPANLQNLLGKKKYKTLETLQKDIMNNKEIRRDSKTALVRDLQVNVIDKGAWVMNGKRDLDITKLLMTKKSAVFSYNDLELAKAEINYFFEILQRTLDKYPKMKPPVIVFEEAHKIFSGRSDQELQRAIEDIILVCRKLGIVVVMTLPTIDGLNKAIVGDIKQWIVGKLRGINAKAVRNVIDDPIMNNLSRLPLDRANNYRQFIYYNSDKDTGFQYEPYECPQEYNRRV